ncbi:hypothetical protein [Glutamicibacter nicotianae]|nr:hypothetical protein [Glutamicibacter nicotianae]
MKHPKIFALALAVGIVTGLAGCTPVSTETEPSSIPGVAPHHGQPQHALT